MQAAGLAEMVGPPADENRTFQCQSTKYMTNFELS